MCFSIFLGGCYNHAYESCLFYHELNILKNGGNQTDPKRSYRHTPAWPKQLGLRPHFRSKRPWEWCKPPHADAAPLSSACSKPVPSPLQLHSLSAGSIKLKPRCFQPHLFPRFRLSPSWNYLDYISSQDFRVKKHRKKWQQLHSAGTLIFHQPEKFGHFGIVTATIPVIPMTSQCQVVLVMSFIQINGLWMEDWWIRHGLFMDYSVYSWVPY